jgi:hypothetical protein
MDTTIDLTRVEMFAGQLATELGAALNAALIDIGDRLGLYRAMADGAALTAEELAGRTGTFERYVREWLNAQAAGGIVAYEPAGDRYTLPAEHAVVLADELSPAAMLGHFQSAVAAIESRERIAECFRTGEGMGWGSTRRTSAAARSARSRRPTATSSSRSGSRRSTAWSSASKPARACAT